MFLKSVVVSTNSNTHLFFQNHNVWNKTKSNDGSGFCPNVTVTSVATLYYLFAAELSRNLTRKKFKIILSGEKQSRKWVQLGGQFVPVLNFPNSTDLAGIIIYQVFIFSFIAWLILSRAILLEYFLLGEARSKLATNHKMLLMSLNG